VYRWIDHTAEIELAIEAGSERDVLQDAMWALAELLGVEPAPGSESRWVTASADDRAALLAAWLEELVYLAEHEGFVATAIDQLTLDEGSLTAVVTGSLGEPPPLVKAITYHRLAFRPISRGYVANVVFDV
jgi:SHS2 domain-containing protein